MTKRFPLLALAALLIAGCHATTGPALPPEANRLHPDHAPTPFSAAQIRDACPEGRSNLYEMQTVGKDKVWQMSTFVVSDPTGAVFEAVLLNADGEEISEPSSANASWEELQAHASFPAVATDIRRDDCHVLGGKHPCWLYTVTEEADGRVLVQRFWFARDLAGPPVRVVQETDGEVTFEMTLLEVIQRD